MSSLYKKEFAWRILFAKLNNRNSSSSKAILNKEQTFCPPSDWWHSTFSAFFFENNALWRLCFVVQVARNFCPTCTVAVENFKHPLEVHQIPCNLKSFLHVVSIFWSQELKRYWWYTRMWSTWFTSNKSFDTVKSKKNFLWKCFESSDSLAISLIIISWYDAIHFF